MSLSEYKQTVDVLENYGIDLSVLDTEVDSANCTKLIEFDG
jgi:hypothetical protein